MEKDLNLLLSEIDQIRTNMGKVVQETDTGLMIYPGWTIKELIAHITAWEIVIHKAILAYLAGDPPYFLHEQDFDIFNEEAVDFRASWSLEKVLQEWKRITLQAKEAGLEEERLSGELHLLYGEGGQ